MFLFSGHAQHNLAPSMPGLEPFMRLGDLLQIQNLVDEGAHLAAFYEVAHLLEPPPLAR